MINTPFLQIQLNLPSKVREFSKNQNWKELDVWVECELKPLGLIYIELSRFIQIQKTEHIISLREPESDEDGIWHDDGSRALAFTLSLTPNKSVDGGTLELREKESLKTYDLETPGYGVLTIFKTGIDGYEHRVLRVEKGSRIMIAGWIN